MKPDGSVHSATALAFPAAQAQTAEQRIQEVLSHVRYKGWSLKIAPMGLGASCFRLWVELPTHCVNTGMPALLMSGEVVVNGTASEDEILRTCLKQILSTEEHEAREHFLYKGVRVFDPHRPVVQSGS